MKYVIDASVLLAVGRGVRAAIHMLAIFKKADVAVPEPVVVYTGIEVRGLPQLEAVKRWEMLVKALPRMSWTSAVTEHLLALEPPSGLAVDLDAITAAHALAAGAILSTMEPGRYGWVTGLRVESID